MNESQRLAYMDAMGVDCYVPRIQLLGALASTLCVMPIVEFVPASEVDGSAPAGIAQPDSTAAAKVAKASGAAATHALFEDDGKKNQRQAIASQQSVAEVTDELVSQTGSSKELPKFILSIVRANNVLLIDEGLPGHVNPQEYLQLLHNLLFALGAGKQTLTIDAFVWPINKNSQFDQSETAARQTLQAFLAKQVEQANIPTVILMGQTAAHYISEQPLAMAELIQHPQLAAQMIRCDSGFPLLAEPLLKKQLWQQLQPLYLTLQSTNAASKAH
ncbi:hypothetical protein [Oceanicoccus sp. KOV_DT_Chl]|uniref:hypothetical protein n=1 Tax=Oceanicoccus sp. KOV_DT_Chl TaxID=1904639 RepID=UPI000C799254|nr:hypothetical protein [Oceanicoccus sp. KOV_DT_Chl]